ncbi:hypothetical protein AAKU67_002527 [Oxalobacteraceae bacterium GrIS 2.11]
MNRFFDNFKSVELVVTCVFLAQLAACGGGGSAGSTASNASPTVLSSQNPGTTTGPTTTPTTTTTTPVTPPVTSETFTIGGKVTGLTKGSTLTLNNNGGDALPINTDGPFTFATPVAANAEFLVTVASQPSGEVCTVSNGSGTGVNAKVTNVNVVCSMNTYGISGTASGLAAGQTVKILNNGSNPQIISANGNFTLSVPVAYNGGYSVTIAAQPTGQTCSVNNGLGSGVVANVTNLSLICSTQSYTIAGTLNGLAAGQQVTLLNNGADPTVVSSSSTFSFAAAVAYNGSYSVTIGTQPVGQSCTVSSGAGAGVVANVNSVGITCSTLSYSVAGTVNGLNSGQQVTLFNNGADPVTVTGNTSFRFSALVSYSGSYSVTIGTQPAGQVCTVSNGTGSGMITNVSDVSVNCSTMTYTITGSVSGLNAGQQVTINDNGANPTTVTSNRTFTFSQPVSYNGSYAVTINTQPNGQVCSVANSAGSNVVANVTGISVTCSSASFTIAGSITGLNPVELVTLLNNGANAQTINGSTSFAFSTPVPAGGSYAVTVGTQPSGQVCTVSNGTGSNLAANIGNISVSCVSTANPYLAPPCNYSATTSTLKITTTTCPGGTQGSAYGGCTISATGGTPPYKFCADTSGSNPTLPEGMVINSATGGISSALIGGQGYYGTKIVVVDSVNNVASKVIPFLINGSNGFLANIFPADSIFHHRVDALSTGLPVDNSPAAPINPAYLSSTFSAAFGNGYGAPWPYGSPAIQVPASQAVVGVTTLPKGGDFTSAQIPTYAPVQGTANSGYDRHVIVYVNASASASAKLYEMYIGVLTNTNNSGSWSDGGNAMWTDVSNSYAIHPQGVGTTNATGLPDGPLLINADEVIGTGTAAAPTGAIKHMIRMTLPHMLDNWVWPATATSGAGSCTGVPTWTMLSQTAPPSACSNTSPAGEIYRIKAGTQLPACAASSPQAAIIMTAMQNYGVVVGDNSFAGQLVGTPDARWNDSDLACLKSLTLASLEPVNVSSLMVSANSIKTTR